MTKANRKKIAKELLAAAERIETAQEYFCCEAIFSHESREYFNALYRKGAEQLREHWISAYFQERDENEAHDEIRSRRVLGLCFAALMAEEGVF